MLLCNMRCYRQFILQFAFFFLFSISSFIVSAQSSLVTDSVPAVSPIHTNEPLSFNSLDSILKSYASPARDEKLIQPIRVTRTPFWTFIIFLFLFALIAFIRFRYTKEFNDTFTVFINNSTFQQVYREAMVSGIRPGYVLMNINFITLTALWVYVFVLRNYNSINISEQLIIPFSWLLIASILMARYFFIQFTAYIITKSKELKFFHFTELHIFRAGGILLFPFILIQYYAPDMVSEIASIIALIIFITFFLYRYLRAYSIVSQAYGKNLFHFFIYICTLEITPVLIGVKLILKNIQ